MAREVDVGGQKYRIGTLNARQQYHVARKLSPFVAAFIEVASKAPPPVPEGEGEAKPDNVIPFAFKMGQPIPMTASGYAQLAGMIEPIGKALADMSMEDSDFVINTCLSAVTRWQGAGWANVIEVRTGQLMFADMQMPTMIHLVWEVIQENILSFFLSAAQPSPTPQAAT